MITGSAVGTFMCLKNVLDGHFTVGDYIMFGTYIGEYRKFLTENLTENLNESFRTVNFGRILMNGNCWTEIFLNERKSLNDSFWTSYFECI